MAGLMQSVFSSWASVFLALAGIATIVLGMVAFVQTRKWPRAETAEIEPDEEQPAAEPEPAAAPAPARPKAARPATTTDLIRIAFPGISEHHPDVWDAANPLAVTIVIDRNRFDPAQPVQATLTSVRNNAHTLLAKQAVGPEGTIDLDLELEPDGETDLVAAIEVDAQPAGQAVRSIRIVDYRAEVVETFEDFVTWAASQFGFIDRKRTAREFVDMFIDGRPGTPAAPLDEIVDIYELANFSDHPVDRGTYLRLVDAFLALEEAGALEGTEER